MSSLGGEGKATLPRLKAQGEQEGSSRHETTLALHARTRTMDCWNWCEGRGGLSRHAAGKATVCLSTLWGLGARGGGGFRFDFHLS